jgi:SAM domain (Sterile alpha motif)
MGGNATFPICPAGDARASKAVICSLKPRHPTPRLFQRCCWWLEGQRDIVIREGLPLLGAEDHRMDIAAWLSGLGLEQYAPAFRDNDVDGDVLPELTADDLISIGVTSVGHRRKLLAAIAALGTEPSTVAQSAASATFARTSPPTIDAERRQLTVMFCDLVGSTALSTRFLAGSGRAPPGSPAPSASARSTEAPPDPPP